MVAFKIHLKEKVRLGDIDFSYLNTITEGDFEFLSTLVDLFINNTPKEIESLEWEVRSRNFEGIMVMAHALKSNLQMFLMTDEAYFLQVTESDARDGFLASDAEENLQTLKQNVLGVVSILKELNAA
ncbi:MAG: hypothetical protein IPH28_17110 [Cytophagaceae bacterium]|nr:hypothetical protein [Cytophagaceae bacterium]MBK9510395.1 hypothetical protein [Cytophagaceae bacterium]MBK9936010.1 hypothetical protein [Cytophagaceae bacterium]MBL0304104.1 hypothetical protein [Cytophagaceae bacterium]MBL0326914.1 hypothetical protein [Cytophagaceae bacterium]